MTTLRQQIMMKRTLRNLRTWAPPISIGVIIGVLAYFAVEKLSDRPEGSAATGVSLSVAPQQAQRPTHAATIQHEPTVNVSYQQADTQRSARVLVSSSVEREPTFLANRQTTPFSNCAAARAAGAAPVYANQPGYGEHLDADHDGIGCEPYHPR